MYFLCIRSNKVNLDLNLVLNVDNDPIGMYHVNFHEE